MHRGRAFIIHGWTGWPEEAWRPRVKAQLEDLGFEVHVPKMNVSWGSFYYPEMREWVGTIERSVVTADEKTIFVAQSLGAVATLRYIEGLPKSERVGGAVLIAGFTHRLIYPQLTSFFETPIDYDAIRERCSKFEFIHCLRDTQVPVEEVHRLQSRLGGNVTITEHGNHFRHQDGVRELPEALAAVMRMKGIKMAVINR